MFYSISMYFVGEAKAFYEAECIESEVKIHSRRAQREATQEGKPVLMQVRPREKFFRYSPNEKFVDKPEVAEVYPKQGTSPSVQEWNCNTGD